MAGDLQDMRARAAAAGSLGERYERAYASYMATKQASIDRRAKKRQEEKEAKRRAELEQAKIAAELKQEKMRQQGAIAQTAQRALFADDAAAADFRNTKALQQQQQKGVMKRDEALAGYDSEQKRKDALAQRARDERQFGYTIAENNQKFGQQLERDYYQQGYDLQRAQQQHGNTLQRDQMQFGFDTKRQQQQSRDTMQRDILQGGIQAQRDQRLNEFDQEQQASQFRNQMQRDQMQQQFEQQSLYQREAADIAARWQEQVYQAKNAGLEFSAKQQKEMQDLDAAFRKNVLNGDWPEDVKHRAMVEHQRKLAAIIPEEKVVNPDDMLQQNVRQDPRTGMWFRQTLDSRGNPSFEPLSTGGSQGEDKQALRQRQAEFERQDRWDKVVKEVMSELDTATETPKYKTDEEILEAAKKRFAPVEKIYRERDKLQPLQPYQDEADKIRAAQEAEARKAQQDAQRMLEQAGANKPKENPWRNMLKDMPAPVAPTRNALLTGSFTPGKKNEDVILSTKPIPGNIAKQLSDIPGGPELHKLREKHSSKDWKDQTIRAAADIVLKAMLTGDTSDPDFAEAQDILKGVGYTLGN